MKTKLLSLLILALVSSPLLPAPAKADTDVFVSFNSPHRGGPRDYYSPPPPPRDWHPRHHWRPEPVFYDPPVYVARPRPVVYETTYVRPQVQYVVPASVMADQSSPTFRDRYGRTCREYTSTSWIGNAPQNTYGTACLMDDGAWRIVN